MPPIFLEALPFLPLTLAPAVFALLAPFVGARTRTVFGLLLLLVAVGFAADVALFDHSATYSLDVPNVFLSADTGQPKEWVVAHESAPAWAWHVCVIVWFGAFGGWLLASRARVWQPRSPVPGATLLFLVYLAVRLALEKTAAHRGVVWATGSAPALVVLLPFFAWHAGRAGYSAARWVRALLVMAFLQRLPLIAFGYFATTRHLGTHLDTHLVGDMRGLFGARHFGGDAVETWLWTTGVPHSTLWVAITLGLGVVLGLVPWLLGRRTARVSAA